MKVAELAFEALQLDPNARRDNMGELRRPICFRERLIG